MSLIGLRTCVWATLSLVLMILDNRQSAFLPRSTLANIVMPLQYVADFPVQLVNGMAENFATKRALLKENTLLKTQQLMLTAELQKMTMLEHENASLHNILQPLMHKKTPILIARVWSVDSDPYTAQVLIDKGENKHVFVGQPVLAAEGVLGQVIQVSALTSRVLLITDLRSGIPVQVVRNGLRGMVLGKGDRRNLSLEYVANTADIKPGDRLVTSGLGGRFPPGYPVAEVIDVSPSPDGAFLQVNVKPSANVNGTNLALLIWPKKDSLSANLE